MKRYILKLYYLILDIRDKFIILNNIRVDKFNKKPKIEYTDETINFLLENNCSMSRYGDGEFSLISGESLKFQPYNKELATKLKNILISDDKNIIIGIPYAINALDSYTYKAQKYWGKYLNLNRNKIYKLLDMEKQYFDTQVTRLYMDTADKLKVRDRFNKLKKIWYRKTIVIVEGEKSRLGVGNDLFSNANSISRIICPSIDAYNKYNDILKEIKKQNKESLILIALGPTATVLSYELSKLGYRALDIGHIDIEYEWFLNNSKQKEPVKNKYIGEINGGDIVEDTNNLKYKKEIIKYII